MQPGVLEWDIFFCSFSMSTFLHQIIPVLIASLYHRLLCTCLQIACLSPQGYGTCVQQLAKSHSRQRLQRVEEQLQEGRAAGWLGVICGGRKSVFCEQNSLYRIGENLHTNMS